MDDAIINDLGYVWSACVYDDMQVDPTPQIMRKNQVKIAMARISPSMDTYDEAMSAIMNYDL